MNRDLPRERLTKNNSSGFCFIRQFGPHKRKLAIFLSSERIVRKKMFSNFFLIFFSLCMNNKYILKNINKKNNISRSHTHSFAYGLLSWTHKNHIDFNKLLTHLKPLHFGSKVEELAIFFNAWYAEQRPVRNPLSFPHNCIHTRQNSTRNS